MSQRTKNNQEWSAEDYENWHHNNQIHTNAQGRNFHINGQLKIDVVIRAATNNESIYMLCCEYFLLR